MATSKPTDLVRQTLLALLTTGVAMPLQASECAAIAENATRLACYDRQFRPQVAETAAKNTESERAENAASLAMPAAAASSTEPKRYATSKMIEDWDLAPDSEHTPFEIRTYKPTYLLIGTHTDNINRQPKSENKTNNVNSQIDLNSAEAQFQLSFKTKLANNLFGDNGSLWVGYTQSSRWQIYSGNISRPFRETNYEPEAMLMFRTPLKLGDWNLRMSGIGINHQSNGRSNPLSRSWNRVIAHVGIEHENLIIQVRPWWRLPEDDAEDNNPGIENYVGRGEVIVAQRFNGHVVSIQGRHSLRSGEDSRGSLKVDWAIPISGRLKGHLSAFSGYGESLIDFNHRQTMFGAGISLVDW